LPYTDQGENHFFERLPGGIVKDITDDLPFDVPSGWEWVRLRSLGTFSGGKTPSMSNSKYWNGGDILWVSPKDMKPKIIASTAMTITKAAADTMKLYDAGTMVIVVRSGILKRLLPLSFLAVPATINQDLKALEFFDKSIADYLYFVIKAFEPYILFELVKAVTTVDSLKFDEFQNLLIPFPPKEEQARIVAKLFDIEMLVDDYELIEQRLSFLNTSFPDALKKSILQAAVQGKLVPQDPHDEPANVLLEKIRVERERLIKAGKIKRPKTESVIFRRDNSHYEIRNCKEVCIDEELPFEIPDSWEWVRIGSVFNLQAGKFVQAQEIHFERENSFPCYGGNGLRGYVDRYNREGAFQLIGRQGALCGNINYADGQFYATEHAIVVEYYCDVNVHWIGYFLNALNLNQYSTATAQPGLAVATINNIFFPFPPLCEQMRIVKKITEILHQCARIA
jgi:type I restriction enzyme S subunit